MRKVQLKRMVAKALIGQEQGLTAQEIYGKLNYQALSKIKNPKHISNILKSMKGVVKYNTGVGVKLNGDRYKVNLYKIDDIDEIMKLGGLK